MLLAFALASCSPAVNRHGYTPVSASGAGPCKVAVKLAPAFGADETEEVGQVEVGDSGVSTDCGESVMIGILRSEACAAGASVVAIYQEMRPDLASTCYRARARLLRFRDPSRTAIDDSRFANVAVTTRSQADSSRTNTALWAAVIADVIGGIVAGIVIGTR